MAKTIVIVLGLSERSSESILIKWWKWIYKGQAKSVVTALQSEEEIHTKVVSSATNGGKLADEIATWGADEVINNVDFFNCAELRKAVDGASQAFIITELDYELQDPLKGEVTIGRSIANACQDSNISHVIYSSLFHVHAYLGLRSDVCDAKAHISDYMDEIKLPKTILYIPFLYEDFIHGFMRPRPTDNPNRRKIIAALGDVSIDMMALDDVGVCIKALFKNPRVWVGKTVALSGEKMSIQEYASQMTDVTCPNTIRDWKVSPEDFISIFDNTAESEDLANYFDYLTRSVARNNLKTTMSLHPGIQTFYNWVRQNERRIQALFENKQ